MRSWRVRCRNRRWPCPKWIWPAYSRPRYCSSTRTWTTSSPSSGRVSTNAHPAPSGRLRRPITCRNWCCLVCNNPPPILASFKPGSSPGRCRIPHSPLTASLCLYSPKCSFFYLALLFSPYQILIHSKRTPIAIADVFFFFKPNVRVCSIYIHVCACRFVCRRVGSRFNMQNIVFLQMASLVQPSKLWLVRLVRFREPLLSGSKSLIVP